MGWNYFEIHYSKRVCLCADKSERIRAENRDRKMRLKQIGTNCLLLLATEYEHLLPCWEDREGSAVDESCLFQMAPHWRIDCCPVHHDSSYGLRTLHNGSHGDY